ncbi:hypothetical protein AB6A40_003079 [Gnathostoma spinigerum]|uniref:Uncharacterized protein n=1 Tax=Gnathostoma spinigerum TaxID=75299 RepID=A0ABD6E8G7_9BILA
MTTLIFCLLFKACSPSRTNGTETLYRAMARSGKPKNRQKTECLSGEDGCSSERADRISFDHLVPPTRKTAENKELRKVNRDTAAYLHQLEGGNHHRGDRKRRPAPRRGNNEDIINTAYSTQSVVNISARIFGDRESGRKRGRSQVLKVTEKVESESSKNGSNLMWLNPGKTNSLLAPENGNETGNNENHHSPGSIDKSQHFPMLQKAIQEENCGISSNKTEVNQMKRLSDRNNTMSFASVKLRQNLTEEAGNRLDKIRHNSLPLNMESSMKNYSHKSQHLYAILPNVHSNDVGFLSKSQGTSDGQQRNGTDFTPSNILRSMQNMPSNLNLRGPLSYSVPSDTTEFSASPSSSSRMKGTTSIETAMNERKTLGTTTDMMRSFPKISSNGPPQIRDKSTKTTRTTATFKANKSINLVKTNDNKHEKTMAKKFVQLTPYDLKYTTQPMGTTIKNMSTKTTEELQGVDAIKGQNNYSNVPRRCISESKTYF